MNSLFYKLASLSWAEKRNLAYEELRLRVSLEKATLLSREIALHTLRVE